MMVKKFLKVALYCERLGLLNGLRIVFKMFTGKAGEIIALRVPGISYPVYIRAKSSDEYTFRQIFVNKEYEFQYDGTPKTIIDAGANIGLAAIYFVNRYPKCKIICLEPETKNTVLLQKNIRMYPSVSSLQCGLWNKSTHLKIKDNGLGNWGFIVEETSADDPEAIQAVSLPDLMKNHNLEALEIVKMDIEGSEKEVLEAEDVHEWLSHCKILVVELHDRMKKGTSAALFRALLRYDAQVEQMGENMVCRINTDAAKL
jgi:FkbM family methyltransferase